MADFFSIVGELFKANAVANEQVNALVEAYLTNPAAGVLSISNGCRVDIAEAMEAHTFARATLSGEIPTPSRKRKAVRAAILLARAQKARRPLVGKPGAIRRPYAVGPAHQAAAVMLLPELAHDPLPPQAAEWREAFGTVRPTSSPWRYLGTAACANIHDACTDFIECFGAEAVRLDWTVTAHFGAHPKHGTLRVDWCAG